MKYISYVRYALILITIVVVTMGITSNPEDVDAMLWFGQGLTIFTMLTLIGMSAYSSTKNPKAAGRSLIGLVIILAVIGLSYALADTTPIVTAANVFDNKSDLLIADTGLISTYIVAVFAVLAILGTETYNFFKR